MYTVSTTGIEEDEEDEGTEDTEEGERVFFRQMIGWTQLPPNTGFFNGI